MRFAFGTLALCVLSLSLAACGDKKNDTEPVAREQMTGNRQGVANQQPPIGGQAGRITANQAYQAQFQEAVSAFLSTDVSPQYVGSVSATGANNSGVTFGGKVVLQNGSLNQALQQGANLNIAGESTIEIQVRDFVPQHPNAPALPLVKLSTAQGYISGTYVELYFSDAFGSVTLQGQINPMQKMFTGTFSFDNNVNYDGSSPGQAGTLGDFQIPMCSFFVCN